MYVHKTSVSLHLLRFYTRAKHCECLWLKLAFFATILLVVRHLLCFYCITVNLKQIIASFSLISDAITVPQDVDEPARGSGRGMLQCCQQRNCVSAHVGDTLELMHYDLFVVLKVSCILICPVRRQQNAP